MNQTNIYFLTIRNLLVLSILFIFPISCGTGIGNNSTSRGGVITFSKTYGGTNYEEGWSVYQTTDGGYILMGQTYSFGLGIADIYLVKTDSKGNELWANTFGGTGNEQGYSVQETSDGGFILFGNTDSFGAGSTDIYLIKTDQNGNEIWSKTFGGSSYEYGYSVQETSDGGYILLGQTYSFGYGNTDMYLIKTDQSGNEIWSKTFGGNYDEVGRAVSETSDGGYILFGHTFSYANNWQYMYLIKTDSNGNELWSKSNYSTASSQGYSVQETSDGGYILFGTHGRFTGLIDLEMYLIKTDSNGVEIWSKAYRNSYMTYGWSAKELSGGGYILLGSSLASAGNLDFYLVKADNNGNELWSKFFGGSTYDEGLSVQQAVDEGFVMFGYTTSFGSGSKDMYLIKTDSNGNL